VARLRAQTEAANPVEGETAIGGDMQQEVVTQIDHHHDF
jgi:hypothetical protein